MIHSPADHHADSEESTEESISDSEEEDEAEVEEDNCNSAGEEVWLVSCLDRVCLPPKNGLRTKSNFLGLRLECLHGNGIMRLFIAMWRFFRTTEKFSIST